MADTKLAKVGITVKESWKDDISYEVLDYTLWRVQDGGDGCGYIAKRANIGVVPNSDDSVWIKATQAGQSIYDLAVKYGHFVGTEEEFEAEYQAALQAARDAASETSATNAEIQEAEELRRASEDERADAETARQESEIAREATESDRQIAENMRQMAETQRGENETTRQSQETARESSETQRQSNESTRQSNETARESAEQERTADFEALKTDMETAIGEADAATAAAVALNNQVAGDESARQQAEQSRVAAETQRQTAETQRGTNEQTRQTQETARQTAESTRNTQETARQTAEGQRATAEQGRASAESGRVSAEQSRVAAETARETQATTDHQRADSDHAIAEEDHATLDEKISHKADIDGSYDGMAVGIARNLEGRTDVTDSFFERTTGGDAEVANGTAQLNEVKGKSQVWNQLSKPEYHDTIVDSLTNKGFTCETIDGVVHFSGTASAGSAHNLTKFAIPVLSGHTYAMITRAENVNGVNYYSAGAMPNNSQNGRNWTRKASNSASSPLGLYINAGTYTDVVLVLPMFIDLTAIFGSDDNIASALGVTTAQITTAIGLAAFEAWLAENIGERAYYPYNPGEVLNNRMTGVESIGFNLLDPATGKADIIGAYSDVYGNYYGITGTHGTLTFTDKFGNEETITPDEDGKFILEKAGTLSVADAGEDCAVFLWWDGTQTEYKPYEKNEGKLDVTYIYGKLNGEGEYVCVWPTGMPGIGDIKDSLKVVDGQVVAERKIGEVDMGTRNWTLSTLFYNSIANIKSGTSALILCSKYNTVPASASIGDKNIQKSTNKLVYVKDSAYSDEASFKASVDGVILYYEMETPQVYTDLIYRNHESFADGTPVTLPMNYKVDNWGIERIAPQNTEETVVTSKPELTMRYSIDAVEELNTHRDEIDDLYEKNEELDQRKPEKYGEYPDMAVGSAKNIAGDLATDAEFKFRKTGGNDAVASGLAKLTAVYGKSLVWNQLNVNGDFSDGMSKWERDGSTVSVSDNIVTLTPNGAYSRICKRNNHIPAVVGHKYYACATIKKTAAINIRPIWITPVANAPISRGDEAVNVWKTYSYIHTASSQYLDVYVCDAQTEDTEHEYAVRYIKNVMVIDLTLMFGAGNEPTTVAEFEAMFPLPYYDYNAGEIISNKAEAIETTGFNLLKVYGRTTEYSSPSTPSTKYTFLTEDMVIRGFAANGYVSASTIDNYTLTVGGIRVKTSSSSSAGSYGVGIPVKVMSGTDYHISYKKNVSGSLIALTYIDANGYIIRNHSVSGVEYDFTTPDNAEWLIIGFQPRAVSTDTTFSDICLNLSNSSRNGEYEPYRKYTLPLNIPTLTGKLNGEGESVVIVPEGLKSTGSVRDELVIKNGYATSIIKRVGIVDLGTLTWGHNSTNVYFNANLPSDAKIGANSVLFICSKYIRITRSEFNDTTIDKVCAQNGGTLVFNIRDTSYGDDAATFKSAMDGVLLYYELATPEEYILDEPFYVGYQEDANGTEKRLPEDTSESVMPAFPCKVAYPVDVVKAINELGNEYVSTKKVQTFTDAERMLALANLGVGFKVGVVKQQLNWSGNTTDGYTKGTTTNIVYGLIPELFIDSVRMLDPNIVFNENTGYFEYKGLTDISYDEMMFSYNFGEATRVMRNPGGWGGGNSLEYDKKFRFVIANTRLNGGALWANSDDLVINLGIGRADYIEVIDLGPEIINNARICKYNGHTYENLLMYRLKVLKSISFEDVKAEKTYQWPSIETCEIFHLFRGLNLRYSSRLSLASVVYMVTYANNGSTPITITLHATAYARCVADTTEYTYNSQTYTGIIALAAAKNITIQSA